MNLFKYQNITLAEAKNRLFSIWVGGFILCFIITFIQSILGKYEDLYMNVVDWYGPLIFPTLTLMIGVLVAGNKQKEEMENATADPTVFKIAELCSLLFIALIVLIFLIEPFLNMTPFALMNRVKVLFTGFNGFLTGLIGYFFIKK